MAGRVIIDGKNLQLLSNYDWQWGVLAQHYFAGEPILINGEKYKVTALGLNHSFQVEPDGTITGVILDGTPDISLEKV